ncbi:hypothetical protein FRC17_002846 [Serendipita sp. 399]|nr:hypothetical protein FRC17_002846 [Serendipita sp. 399]
MASLMHSPDSTQPQAPFSSVARTRTRTRDMHIRLSPEDVQIRSSDNVTFYIHKPLLVYASPIFKDMFDLCTSHPQPPSPPRRPPSSVPAVDDDNGLPLLVNDETAQSSHHHQSSAADITLSEPASTLSLLFAHLDPTAMARDVLATTMTIDDVWLCMSAAVKYQMDGVLLRLRSVLTSPSSSSSSVATSTLPLHTSQQQQSVSIPVVSTSAGDGGLVVHNPLPASVLAYQFGFLPELRLALRELAKCHIRHLMLSSSAAAPHTDTPGGSTGGGGTTMIWQAGVPLILLRYILQLRRARARWFISKARLLYQLPTMDDYPPSTHPSTSASGDTRFTSPSSSWWFWGSTNTENDAGVGYHRSKGGNEQTNRDRKQGGKGGGRGSGCTQCMRYRALHLHEVCNVLVDHPSWDVFRHQLFHSGSYSPHHQRRNEDEDDDGGGGGGGYSENSSEGHGRAGVRTTMVHCVCGSPTIPLDAHPRLVLDWTQWERDAKRLEQELPVWPPPSLATTTTTTTTAAGF